MAYCYILAVPEWLAIVKCVCVMSSAMKLLLVEQKKNTVPRTALPFCQINDADSLTIIQCVGIAECTRQAPDRPETRRDSS
mmetsp:Transcript_12628/g.35029  ORF Transcript_12628/g.35029 Transcript_12628/m.35029 type:complete len:81 (-) Transcript_12628:1050-1292(-)